MPLVVLLLAVALLAAPLPAQEWNTPEAATLVRRAVERRLETEADSGLTAYRARAHGFVFFLAQVGDGFREPPRLVKADELDVEVYWRAPGRSKQVILGWRDGSFLPTDISYHRDHLGIVTNNFGHLIRLGEGDEVRDAIHPLSPQGLTLYDYALQDSIRIRSGQGELTVHEVLARPRDPGRPLVVGTLYVDAATAELVRFRFSFTRAAYREPQLEDITVVLENALHEGRYWLPFQQEIEIRRRTTWLEFPARGIIRGRWEIGAYELNAAFPPEVLAGPSIGGLTVAQDSGYAWTTPLAEAIGDVAAPINRQDMEEIRLEVEEIVGTRALTAIARGRLTTRSLSEMLKVNRVQGLALGIGGAIPLFSGRLTVRPSVGLGTSDGRLTGSLVLETRGAWLGVRRDIRDLADFPVIAPVLNSILSQEAGEDYGDYVLVESAEIGARHRLGTRTRLEGSLGVESATGVLVEATPANGTYRPNPDLGAPTYGVARVLLERAPGGIALRHDIGGSVAIEAADGPTSYMRVTAEGRWRAGIGRTELLSRLYVGLGTDRLPAYRSFVVGGRGTLVGEPFRAYGGRQMALAHLEWRFAVPIPALRLGSFASTGNRLVLAPFVAGAWSARPVTGSPWPETDGIRPVVGVAAEWFMRLLRLEAGVNLRDGSLGLTVDIHRDWWPLL
ncbi:MAG: hypothetical protein HKM89_08100 [Gemmatimonadales bacterium]|nr:hypothetical protein [Gemmatimonadales bacterium]